MFAPVPSYRPPSWAASMLAAAGGLSRGLTAMATDAHSTARPVTAAFRERRTALTSSRGAALQSLAIVARKLSEVFSRVNMRVSMDWGRRRVCHPAPTGLSLDADH